MRKGKPVDGLLLVDKDRDLTSHDAVAIARRQLNFRKIGHTGTLDPMATGLLVLCLGGATRLQSYLMGMDKTYEGTIQFGWATNTYDAVGEPAEDPAERSIESVDFEPVIDRFRGRIDQVPPAFSAKKIQGVRAYEMARKGETPALEARSVEISEFEVTGIEASRLQFRIRCSAGTYVRSIAHDLGREIGIPAHLGALRRTAVGEFEVADAVPTATLREKAREEILASDAFTPLERVRLPLTRVVIDPMQQRKIATGQTIVVRPQSPDHEKDELVSLATVGDQLVAIGQVVEVIGAGGGPIAIRPKVVLGTGGEGARGAGSGKTA